MAKLFISFLGTNDYLPCNYVFGKKKEENVRFVQEAMAKIFCGNWGQDDRIVIFLTKKAKQINWFDKKTGRTDDFSSKGQQGLHKCLNSLNFDCSVKGVDIVEGYSEEEVWQIFATVFESVCEKDEIILDITHAFRSIPMLGMVLLNYAKSLKNITVEGIYYGAFEKLGTRAEVEKKPMSGRNANILDLTAFSKLQEWSVAADNFVNLGNANRIAELTRDKINPVLSKSKGADSLANKMKEFANLLMEITGQFSCVRGKNIVEGREFSRMKRMLEDINKQIKSGSFSIKPLEPIFNKIKDKLDGFKENEGFQNGLKAVRWCVENNLIQQGITLLQEIIINKVLDDCQLDYKKESYRNIASSCFSIISMNISPEKWTGDAGKQKEIANRILGYLRNNDILGLKKVFTTLTPFRNDINHAGLKESSRYKPRDANKFAPKLENLLERVEKYCQQ